jgi:AhpD family alkylhydroperoxidase
MQARISHSDFYQLAPEVRPALLALSASAEANGIDRTLQELIKIRASQINGCAFCLDLHTRDATRHGEIAQRLHLIAVWREAPVFTERERAALAWTESVTLLAQDHVPDAVYEEVRRHFSEKELAYLTGTIVAINGWNRIAAALRFQPAVKPVVAAKVA